MEGPSTAPVVVPQSNCLHGIMDDHYDGDEDGDLVGSRQSSSFSDDEELGERSSNSVGSTSSSDLAEDAASSVEGPLSEMSSLFSQLPFRRGLSIHFEGKSQSFASLSNVRSLEDLVKPDKEDHWTKMMKQRKRKSCSGRRLQEDGRHKHKASASSKATGKKGWRGSFVIKRSSTRHRPPPPPPPSGMISSTGQALLFA